MNIKWLSCVQSHVIEEHAMEDVESDGQDAEPEWLLQLQEVLFSSAPSERNKATGVDKTFLVRVAVLAGQRLPGRGAKSSSLCN